jgi:hypothetical protein
MSEPPELRIEFEDRRLDEVQPWRQMDAWEESVLRRHLEVDFEGAEALRSEGAWPRVRAMDECGCLEFEREDSPKDEPHRIVTDGYGPDHPDGHPFQTMLTVSARNELLWLEFHRFGGAASHRPGPSSLKLIR